MGIKPRFLRCFACIPITINTFGHIHKVAKSDYKLHCVCLPACQNVTASGQISQNFVLGISTKICRENSIWLQSYKIKRHFTWKHIFVIDFISNITKVTNVSVIAIFTLLLWLLWWMLPLIFLLPLLIWLPSLVLFLSFAIIFVKVTKQHILELYFLFSPHGQMLTKILVSIS